MYVSLVTIYKLIQDGNFGYKLNDLKYFFIDVIYIKISAHQNSNKNICI